MAPHPHTVDTAPTADSSTTCQGDVATPSQTVGSIKQTVRKLMRPAARTAYRLLKPILKPIAFRARRYLTDELRQNIQQEVQHSLSVNLHKFQEIRHLFHQDVLASQLVIHQDLQKTTAHLVQEVQRIQASLHRDVAIAQFATVEQLDGKLADIAASVGPKLDRIEVYSYATARRIAVNCGGDAVLVKSEAGFVLCGANDHALLASLLDAGELERGTRLLIEKFLRPGDCFIDVGANIGMHTLAAARAMQGRGKIIAFEPFGPTKALLERSVWMNGLASMVEIHQAAVSNETGSHTLFLGATSGHHSLFPLHEGISADAAQIEVPVVRLDDVIPTTQKVNLLKIDAEGAELKIIESASHLIERNPDLAIISEFGPAHLKRTGVSPTDWLNAFAARGLEYRAINDVSGNLEHREMEYLLACDSINLLFSRKEASAWGRLGS
ncbi:FkbM family methyltransferase [Burkholderia contaminans]|uniref:FkbM family methyltransferase n=1 Tax=Burkholderia contaminans TaxID=488447 RepID=UPI002D7F7A86|nr:FkbM family methyltransferase [Burkholderia contaminans]